MSEQSLENLYPMNFDNKKLFQYIYQHNAQYLQPGLFQADSKAEKYYLEMHLKCLLGAKCQDFLYF